MSTASPPRPVAALTRFAADLFAATGMERDKAESVARLLVLTT
jgi:LDH2 family malate/lactate/ureidoglycolate dehydrogenase